LEGIKSPRGPLKKGPRFSGETGVFDDYQFSPQRGNRENPPWEKSNRVLGDPLGRFWGAFTGLHYSQKPPKGVISPDCVKGVLCIQMQTPPLWGGKKRNRRSFFVPTSNQPFCGLTIPKKKPHASSRLVFLSTTAGRLIKKIIWPLGVSFVESSVSPLRTL